jgi:YVTN family beta-propeller protein
MHVARLMSIRTSTCAYATLALTAWAACRPPDPPPRVIVSNEHLGTVSVIDPALGVATATIPVGKRPRGLRVSPDGRTLYVALSGSPRAAPGADPATLPPADRAADGIGIVDLDRLALVDTIPSGQDPEAFDLVGAHTLVVSNEETAEASIVDLVSRRVRARVAVGGEPEGVATAPDGLVWVTSEADHVATILDPRTARVVATVPTGLRPRSIAFGNGYAVIPGEHDASVTIADVRAREVVARIELPTTGGQRPLPMGVAVARDGRTAYVSTGRAGSVAVIDLDRRELVRFIEQVGARPWGIALGADGLLYTANGPSDDVAVIDPETSTVVRRIRSPGSPWGVIATR